MRFSLKTPVAFALQEDGDEGYLQNHSFESIATFEIRKLYALYSQEATPASPKTASHGDAFDHRPSFLFLLP